jgi:hypothetical protein
MASRQKSAEKPGSGAEGEMSPNAKPQDEMPQRAAPPKPPPWIRAEVKPMPAVHDQYFPALPNSRIPVPERVHDQLPPTIPNTRIPVPERVHDQIFPALPNSRIPTPERVHDSIASIIPFARIPPAERVHDTPSPQLWPVPGMPNLAPGRMPTGEPNLEEAAVFSALRREAFKSRSFSYRFGQMNDARKRELALFARAEALSDFSRANDPSGSTPRASAEKLDSILSAYLEKNGVDSVLSAYFQKSSRAEACVRAFIGANPGIAAFLGGQTDDFKSGLKYFFMEHNMTDAELAEKSRAFSGAMFAMKRVSDYLLGMRDSKEKFAPSSRVSDDQVREVCASAYFGKAFYGMDAKFMLSIALIESNLEMVSGVNGTGITQQTGDAANNDLKSENARSLLSASANIGIERQMVDMQLLGENVFLNMMEGVKTASLKCIAAKVPASSLSSAPASLDATAHVAFLYNGNTSPFPGNPELTYQQVYESRFREVYKLGFNERT